MKMEEGRELVSRTDETPPMQTAERAKRFAVRVIRLCQWLEATPGVQRTLSHQLLRAGTSIGANLHEAQSAHSRADFLSKLTIALKEARETAYWLEIMVRRELVRAEGLHDLLEELDELTRILVASIVTAKKGKEAS